MTVWLTSDTHFNHRKLEEYGRPKGFEELILQGLRRLPEGSVLVHLGDFCIGEEEKSHQLFMEATQQCSRRILVRGNHDGKSNNWYLSHGWDFVCREFVDKYFGKRILFKHIPVPKKVKPNHLEAGFKAPVINFQVHGHTHGDTHRDTEVMEFYKPWYHVEVALEKTDYKPVKLEDILPRVCPWHKKPILNNPTDCEVPGTHGDCDICGHCNVRPTIEEAVEELRKSLFEGTWIEKSVHWLNERLEKCLTYGARNK